jgi:hypothetical protein
MCKALVARCRLSLNRPYAEKVVNEAMDTLDFKSMPAFTAGDPGP